MSTVLATTLRPSMLRRFTTAHPVAAFLSLTFLVAYPSMLVVALAIRGLIPGAGLLARLPIPPDEVVGLVLTLGGLLPAAVYVTWVTEGRAGVVRLARRILRWRLGVGWWLAIVVALPLLTVVSGLLLGDSLRHVDPLRLVLSQVFLLLVNLVAVNLWEETAWAGVLQTRLERGHNLIVAAFLTALPFGLVHWPLILFERPVSVGSVLLALPGYLLLGLLVRPLLGLVLRGTGDSILAVALTHSVVNRTQNSNGIGASLLEGQGHRLGFLLVLVLLTVVTAVVLRGRLSRESRQQLDGRVST